VVSIAYCLSVANLNTLHLCDGVANNQSRRNFRIYQLYMSRPNVGTEHRTDEEIGRNVGEVLEEVSPAPRIVNNIVRLPGSCSSLHTPLISIRAPSQVNLVCQSRLVTLSVFGVCDLPCKTSELLSKERVAKKQHPLSHTLAVQPISSHHVNHPPPGSSKTSQLSPNHLALSSPVALTDCGSRDPSPAPGRLGQRVEPFRIPTRNPTSGFQLCGVRNLGLGSAGPCLFCASEENLQVARVAPAVRGHS
jgi:hypothetical protein